MSQPDPTTEELIKLRSQVEDLIRALHGAVRARRFDIVYELWMLSGRIAEAKQRGRTGQPV